MDFFGIGFGELILILLVALIIWGPRRIPEIARTLGRMVHALKKASSDMTTEITREIEEEKDPSLSKEVSSDKSEDSPGIGKRRYRGKTVNQPGD